MYSLIALVHLAEGANRNAVHQMLEGVGLDVASTLEGHFNGGDMIVRGAFDSEAAYRSAQGNIGRALHDPAIAHCDTAFYRHGVGQARQPQLAGGVYRALLLCADQAPTQPRLEQFSREMLQMPRHIGAIANWRLSPVLEAGGTLGWTHVWEQDYAGIEGLFGPYMMLPYHWAHIDRWFDPECPDWLVNPHLCHSFCASNRPIAGLPAA